MIKASRGRIVEPISLPTTIVISGFFGEGASLVLGRIFQVDVNPALASTVAHQVTLGVLLMVGSAFMVAAGLKWKRISTTWRLELIALPILISAWTLYTISIAFPPRGFEQDPAAFPIILGISFTLSCAVRLFNVLGVIKKKRRQVKALPPEVRDA